MKLVMKKENKIGVGMAKDSILPILAEIAVFRKESKEEDRGKYYFSDEPNEE